MKNNTIITIVLLVIVGAVAFFAGIKYQQGQRPASFGQFGDGQGQRPGNNRNGGLRPVVVQILNSDDKSTTIKLQDGSSVIAILSSNTSINKAAQASLADLK